VTLRDATIAAGEDFVIKDAEPPVFERVAKTIGGAGMN
jgi:hypothetical protein